MNARAVRVPPARGRVPGGEGPGLGLPRPVEGTPDEELGPAQGQGADGGRLRAVAGGDAATRLRPAAAGEVERGEAVAGDVPRAGEGPADVQGPAVGDQRGDGRAVVAVGVGGAAGNRRPARAVPAGEVGSRDLPVGHGEVAAHVDTSAGDGDRVHRAVEAGAHRLPAAPVPHRDALVGVVRRPGHPVDEVAAEVDRGAVDGHRAAAGGQGGGTEHRGPGRVRRLAPPGAGRG